MKNVESLFSQNLEKYINLFKTEIEGYENTMCYYTHIYSSSRPFKFGLLVRTLHM